MLNKGEADDRHNVISGECYTDSDIDVDCCFSLRHRIDIDLSSFSCGMQMTCDLRRTAPAPVIEYFLDGAQGELELDACTAMTLRLYGDDAVLLPIVSGEFRGYKERRKHCLALTEAADAILPLLPIERRDGLIHKGLGSIGYAIEQLAECYSMWAIEDEVDGGCMLPFRERLRSRNGIVFKNTMRHLRSPRFIRKYVKRRREDVGHLIDLTKIMMRRVRETPSQVIRDDRGIMSDWRAQYNFMSPESRWNKQFLKLSSKPDKRAERKMIKRSLQTAISILGIDIVKEFLRGEAVKISGTDTILVIKKRAPLNQTGHGCLSVGLADRNGVLLADLCTFVEKTPTLDQLSAFALWMMSGEERQVIETANVIDLAPAGVNHPLFIEKREQERREFANLIQEMGPEKAEQVFGLLTRRSKRKKAPRQLSYEAQRERNCAYWEETKSVWMEAMLVLVLGRDVKLFQDLRG